jgi:tRNA-intron endonuclease
MDPFIAIYTKNKIIIPTQSEADSLFQNGFGYRKNKQYFLNYVETLYNIERGKISVVDEDNNKLLSFQNLYKILSSSEPDLWIKFMVYKDLRTRGFIVNIKNNFFRVYERGNFGKTRPSYQLKIISEGKPEKIRKLLKELETLNRENLSMKLAVIDRRGEIVYYGVEEKVL